jgi:hypothetical protein
MMARKRQETTDPSNKWTTTCHKHLKILPFRFHFVRLDENALSGMWPKRDKNKIIQINNTVKSRMKPARRCK